MRHQFNEIKRLITACDFSEGFSLFFAVYDTKIDRKETIKFVKRSLPKQIIGLELEKEEPFEPYKQISNKLQNVYKGGVVFIYGLENLVKPDFDDFSAKILFSLNLGREHLTKFGYPIVFWVPEYLIRLIATKAPDFYDWRSGVFRFCREIKEKDK